MAREIFDRDRLADYGKRGFQGGLSTLGDFRKFLLRGNVVDLAVGVVIGAAFNGLVQAFVNDVIKPLIGLLGNGQNFSGLHTILHGQTFLWGDLIGVFISFILTAAVVYFFVVKPINALQDGFGRLRPKHEVAPTTRDCPFCLSTVNLKATRCAYCTAQLPPVDGSQAQANVAPSR
ncbi:large conductance mechanosensitive channel protein MscL [Dictyobacter arantiisoli]|uniref:Large-conductance mechanosensitive channel n=1 Tax=Dictyobacter arantiisoli TaxID=2014874 RepID=A0A5A5T5G8_9CHLR|nr:large conductance mechanosensitive channel protein MscL [Dictyobacter arantiisoli]GCF06661.1 large-conductance mechanosensitive channel [Dictyobacter arantiisoli]